MSKNLKILGHIILPQNNYAIAWIPISIP